MSVWADQDGSGLACLPSADVATWTGSAVKRICILYVARPAGTTDGEVELIVVRNVLQQIPRPFEGYFVIRMQQLVGLERATHAMTILDVGPWPATVNTVLSVDSEEQAGAEKCKQCRRLQLIYRVFNEQRDLLGRFTASPLDGNRAGVAKIGIVELANPVIAQPGAIANRPRSCLVLNHAQRQFELSALVGIAIVSEFHFLPFLIEISHI